MILSASIRWAAGAGKSGVAGDKEIPDTTQCGAKDPSTAHMCEWLEWGNGSRMSLARY
jgi:hypothetical protein